MGVHLPEVEDVMCANTSGICDRAFDRELWRLVPEPVTLPVARDLSEARFWVEHGLLLSEAARSMDTSDRGFLTLSRQLATSARALQAQPRYELTPGTIKGGVARGDDTASGAQSSSVY